MRSSGPLGLLAAISALSLVACSSSSPGNATPVFDGGRDTSLTDASTDTGGFDAGTDSGAVDASGDGADAGAGCDQHPGDTCNMALDNCPANQMCDYTSSHFDCVTPPQVGPNADGDPCSSASPCAAGLICETAPGTTTGVCSRPCCPGDDTPCRQNGQTGSCSLNIIDPTTSNTDYHLCQYNQKVCKPFEFDCGAGEYCNFSASPDVFTCSSPSPSASLSQAPGVACSAINDCGESQGCLTITHPYGGPLPSKCYLFCWLTKPASFTPGTTPGGRFPASGGCTINGTSYGTCSSVGFPDNTASGGGQLGVCM